MYDSTEHNGRGNDLAHEQMPAADGVGEDAPLHAPETQAETLGDQTGVFADFVRKQPIITLSIAFGLGLLATSLLARRHS
jgi:hypothetical protein